VSSPGSCGGKLRADVHRINAKHIILDHQRGGMSPDEIVLAYPALTLTGGRDVGGSGDETIRDLGVPGLSV
jgi:hypothetical protein